MNEKAIKAISDSQRIKLMKKINEGEVCACGLPCCSISQPAISQHLKILLDSNLVTVRKSGKNRLYSLSGLGKKVLKDIEKW